MDDLKRSPLDEVHREAGGRMASFAGWEMPVMYESISDEHCTVRDAVGQFDISHLGQLFVKGESAGEWLNGLLTNDVSALKDGEGQYTLLLNVEGGVIDDLILYRLASDCYLLVVTAGSVETDKSWLGAHAHEDVLVLDESESIAGIAVQGPKAVDVFSRVFGGRTLPSRNGIDVLTLEGRSAWICRSGYTGEDGFEFFCSPGSVERWWEEFAEAGAKPCGLGARDSLRLEKCFPRNGSDLTPRHTPLQAGLDAFVKLEKGDFIGSDVLHEQKENPPEELLSAILCEEKGADLNPGCPVLDTHGVAVGSLTSGMLSPCLKRGIGLAYLPRKVAEEGTELLIEAQGKTLQAKVVKKPFVG